MAAYFLAQIPIFFKKLVHNFTRMVKTFFSRHFSVFQWQKLDKFKTQHDNLPESSFQGDPNLLKTAYPSTKTYDTSPGFCPATFPVCGDCNVLFYYTSFVFHLFHVLGAKKSASKPDSGNRFLNSLNCSGIFLVLKLTYIRALFQLGSQVILDKILTKCGPRTLWKTWNVSRKIICFPLI